MTVNKTTKPKKPRQIPLKGIKGKIKPTAQQLLIAKGLVEGKKKGAALIGAGVPKGSARSNSALILGKPGIQVALKQTLQDAGVTTKRIAEVLNEGLSATKVIVANLLVIGKDGSDLPDKNGDILDGTETTAESKQFIRVEDFAVRHKYLETSCKLLDLFPTEGSVTTEERVTVSEEKNLIDQAEESVGKRNISRYMVKRERTQSF